MAVQSNLRFYPMQILLNSGNLPWRAFLLHNDPWSFFHIATAQLCTQNKYKKYIMQNTELPKYYARLQMAVASGLGCPTSESVYWHCSQTHTAISVQFLSPISSNVSSVRTWHRRLTFLFFTKPVSLKQPFSLSPNCTGIKHRSSWKLYSKFE